MPRGPVVYLLHFAEPLHHAGHYLGMARSLRRRLRQHQNGDGSRLMAVITELGISYRVARVWPCPTLKAAYELEAKLKRQKNGRKHCPVCQEGGA